MHTENWDKRQNNNYIAKATAQFRYSKSAVTLLEHLAAFNLRSIWQIQLSDFMKSSVQISYPLDGHKQAAFYTK